MRSTVKQKGKCTPKTRFSKCPLTVRVSTDRNSRNENVNKNSVSRETYSREGFFTGHMNTQIKCSCPEELEMHVLLCPRM